MFRVKAQQGKPDVAGGPASLLTDLSTLQLCWLWVLKTCQQRGSDVACVQPTEISVPLELAIASTSSMIGHINGNQLASLCFDDETMTPLHLRCLGLGLLYGALHYKRSETSPPCATVSPQQSTDDCPKYVLVVVPATIQLAQTSGVQCPLLRVLSDILRRSTAATKTYVTEAITTGVVFLSYRFGTLPRPLPSIYISKILFWALTECLSPYRHCSLDVALVVTLAQLPTSTFARAAQDVALISSFCELLCPASDNRIVFTWLAQGWGSKKPPPGKSDQDGYGELSCSLQTSPMAPRVLFIALAMYRALSWVRVDGLTPDQLLHATQQQPASRDSTPVGLTTEAVAARKAAMRLLSAMWQFCLESDTTRQDTENCYVLRNVACLLLGRELVFGLADIGRVSEVQEIIRSLSSATPPLLDRLFEAAAQRGSPEDLTWFEQLMLQWMQRANRHTQEQALELGVSLLQPSCATPTPTLHSCPPALKTLVSRENVAQTIRPILLIRLLSQPPVDVLQCFDMELPLMRTLDFLVTKVNRKTIQQHVSWMFSQQRSLQSHLQVPAMLMALARQYRLQAQSLSNTEKREDTPAVTSASRGLGIMELTRQFLMVTQFSSVPSQCTLLARIRRSLLIEWFLGHYSVGLAWDVERLESIWRDQNKNEHDDEQHNEGGQNAPTSSTGRHAETDWTGGPPSARENDTLCRRPSSSVSTKTNEERHSGSPIGTTMMAGVTRRTRLHLPPWALHRAVQVVCFPNNHGFSWFATTQAYVPYLFPQLLWELLQQGSHHTLGNLTTSGTAVAPIHALLSSLLHFVSLFLEELTRTLGSSCHSAVALALFEYCIYQLKHTEQLPSIPDHILSQLRSADRTETHHPSALLHPSFTSYYPSVCEHTLVGRLLILCGVEPQQVFLSQKLPSRSTSLVTTEAQKTFIYPPVGPELLESRVGIRVAPFTDPDFPISTTFFELLADVFLLLFLKLPSLWPSDRLLAAV